MLAALTMSRRPSRSWRHRGLTLVEALVALAVLGVVLAMATPSLADLLERRRIIAAADEISSVIHHARSEPNVIGDKLTLHFDVDASERLSCVALVTQSGMDMCKCYETPVCASGGSKLLRVFQLENARGVSFLAHADSWGSNEVNWLTLSRRQAMMDATGVEIDVKGRRTGAQLRLEMNNFGRVRICSPNNSISGYPTCS